jgi:hypothetical protein
MRAASAKLPPMRTVFALLALCVTAVPAHAQVTTFTSRSAWNAAAGTSLTIDFEGIVAPDGFQTFPSLTLSGVTFVSGGGTPSPVPPLLAVAGGATLGVSSWNSGAMLTATSLGTQLGNTVLPTVGSVMLPYGVTAFGFNYGTTAAGIYPGIIETGPWSVQLSTGQTFPIAGSSSPPTMAFFGVVSKTPISSIQINPGATFELIDNFSYVPPVTVPALPAWGVLALATLLAVTAVASIRRRHTAPLG